MSVLTIQPPPASHGRDTPLSHRSHTAKFKQHPGTRYTDIDEPGNSGKATCAVGCNATFSPRCQSKTHRGLCRLQYLPMMPPELFQPRPALCCPPTGDIAGIWRHSNRANSPLVPPVGWQIVILPFHLHTDTALRACFAHHASRRSRG